MAWTTFVPSSLSGQWTQLSVETQRDYTADALAPHLREQYPMVLSEKYPFALASYYTTIGTGQMPGLSTFTVFSLLTDGAPASASYFNAKFTTISGNLDQLNSDTSSTNRYITLSGNTLSTGTVAFSASTFSGSFIGGQYLSTRTLAVSQSSLNMSVNEVIFSIFGASGASLAIRSGGTIWVFNSDLSTVG